MGNERNDGWLKERNDGWLKIYNKEIKKHVPYLKTWEGVNISAFCGCGWKGEDKILMEYAIQDYAEHLIMSMLKAQRISPDSNIPENPEIPGRPNPYRTYMA